MAQIELNLEIDPVERLKIETENAENSMMKCVGEYLLEKFNKDEVLKNCYKDRKVTLAAIKRYVNTCANKYLNGVNGGVEDKVVYGWVLHYVQDEKVEITNATTITLTKQEKKDAHAEALAKYKKDMLHELENRSSKPTKAKKEKKDDGQLSLFE